MLYLGYDDRSYRLMEVQHRTDNIKANPPLAVLRSLDIIVTLLFRSNQAYVRWLAPHTYCMKQSNI